MSKNSKKFDDRIFYIKDRKRDDYNYDEVIFTKSDFLDRMEYFKGDIYDYTRVKIYFKKSGDVYTYRIESPYLWEELLKFADQSDISKDFLNTTKYIKKEKYKDDETLISNCFEIVKKVVDK